MNEQIHTPSEDLHTLSRKYINFLHEEFQVAALNLPMPYRQWVSLVPSQSFVQISSVQSSSASPVSFLTSFVPFASPVPAVS